MGKIKGHVVIVEDDNAIRISAQMLLNQHFSRASVLDSPEKLPNYIKVYNPDVVVLDMNFSPGKTDGKEGFKWLTYLNESHPQIIVCVITAFGEVELAVRALRNGAFDFIIKPWENQKFIATLSAGILFRESKTRIHQLKKTQKELNKHYLGSKDHLVGESEQMQEIRKMLKKVAPTPADVLITGDNGSGKGLLAKEIHCLSPVADKAFVHVDLSSLPETLFESELFGHEKGAFTGANEARPGRFELAHGGTLFLDEIGNLPVHLQSKLLVALQERKISRLGTTEEIRVDFRLITATNQDLFKMVDEESFRQDLLYRINTIEIHIPSLRHRPDDISILCKHFLDIYSKKYRKPELGIEDPAMHALKKYTWPGNIRELMHTMERAVILCEENTIKTEDLSLRGHEQKGSELKSLNLNELERMAMLEAIERSNGNITKAAEMIGISRVSFYRNLKKHGIKQI
ncbi:MAG: sigma-54-dependent Fis family transcriptional regulator [Bacteroidetes bacterium]|jgi:two-component system, NtrC family, response regulator HydG|nr:sigma-54-dependent Fis family transcriptional regulator [Bacteroidota bacterium]MBT3751494.1 sigma-54-dependent Fis family transcriptional regulator [Bacteroidota bacterium]MBT4399206.1 sigma-54-dependent Fis family transcriptional regulator [Bacteroidota bacterium]MBT4412325.1 sigma-54-dependent Fis family transcriptional regulator [Bacteroidota bacterium]MBT7094812.1 sigma-54-dependent Fis family transcriptional regulator [Bacteroidota bacterium]